MKHRTALICLILFWMPVRWASAQNNYSFELVTLEERANFGDVRNIFRDRAGVVWMGVFGKGLAYYDGRTVTLSPLEGDGAFSIRRNVFTAGTDVLYLNYGQSVRCFDPVLQRIVDSIGLEGNSRQLELFAFSRVGEDHLLWAVSPADGAQKAEGAARFEVLLSKNGRPFRLVPFPAFEAAGEPTIRVKGANLIARDGQAGIDLALDLIPDIVISDVMMPKRDGFEVCETLKTDERTSHIPIILLTAKAAQEDKVRGLRHGADAFLTKPFDRKELFVRLEKLVALRRALQQRYSAEAGGDPAPGAPRPLDDAFLLKLRTAAEARLHDADFGAPDLARDALMGQTQVYRKLKALTGLSPSQFIRSVRLHKSLDLLKSGELTISEIAYEVGFTDPNYFSRVFHEAYGQPPSDYWKT